MDGGDGDGDDDEDDDEDDDDANNNNSDASDDGFEAIIVAVDDDEFDELHSRFILDDEACGVDEGCSIFISGDDKGSDFDESTCMYN
jgi:hypothetical protein